MTTRKVSRTRAHTEFSNIILAFGESSDRGESLQMQKSSTDASQCLCQTEFPAFSIADVENLVVRLSH